MGDGDPLAWGREGEGQCLQQKNVPFGSSDKGRFTSLLCRRFSRFSQGSSHPEWFVSYEPVGRYEKAPQEAASQHSSRFLGLCAGGIRDYGVPSVLALVGSLVDIQSVYLTSVPSSAWASSALLT